MAEDLADALARAHAQRRAVQAYASSITQPQAANIGALHSTYPFLGGTALSLGVAGVAPEDPLVRQVAEVKARKDDEQGWMGKIGHAITGGALKHVKEAARGALTTVNAPWQFAQGQVRTGLQYAEQGDYLSAALAGSGVGAIRDFGKNAGQTTLAQALTRDDDLSFQESLAPAGDPSKATWFPAVDSPAESAQRRHARAVALVDGRAATLGRITASVLPIEPGTNPYNVVSGLVDFSALLFGDPVGHGFGQVAKANRGRGVISTGRMVEREMPTVNEAGAVDGLRKTVLPERALQWLDSAAGNRVADELARGKDFEAMRRATGKKLPVDLLVRLVDAKDSAAVKGLLAEAVNDGVVRTAPRVDLDRTGRSRVGVGGFRLQSKKPPARLAGMMPGSKIDLDDMDDAVEQLDRFQRNVRLPEADISRNNEALARAGSSGEKYQIVRGVMDTVKQGLIQNGVDRGHADKVTRMFEDARESTRRYYVDEIGENARVPGVVIGGDGKPLPSPHLATELLDRYIPLPNARDLKRAARTSEIVRKIEGLSGVRATVNVADVITTDLFKTFALALRPAWTVRVVGEEQVRMGAGGMDSMFRHPLSYLSWVAGEKPGGLLAKAMRGGKGGQDALGQAFRDVEDAASSFQQALNRGSAGWRDRHVALSRHWTTYAPHEPEYGKSWAGELVQLAEDPVARQLARSNADDVKRMFWDGPLTSVRRDMELSAPDMNLGVRAQSDAYVDSVLERIGVKTAGHADLHEAIATGRLNGERLTDGFDVNPRVTRALEGREGPAKVKGQIAVAAHATPGSQVAQTYDRTAEAMFNALGSVPTNKLSRSPVFRQQYWNRIEEALPLLTGSERIAAVRAAKEAGMSKAVVQRMRDAAHGPAGDLTLAELDNVAKRYALDETRQLLYSLHEKAQVMDALRIVFPFGEAWREVLTRWARLAAENPNVPYRGNQLVTNAREQGFFYDDPETGEEMFAYPGSQWLTGLASGVPAPLEARASGLNMASQVLPGFGPVVTIPVSKVMPESPRWDEARAVLFPFGEPNTEAGALESMLPSYVQKLRLAFTGGGSADAKRALAGTTRDVMAYLYSTGDYDISTPEGQQKLLDEAKGKARRLYLVRAMAQAGAPSSPTARMVVRDKDGSVTALHILADDYRQMQEQDAATATERFLGKYGDFAFLITVPKTQGSVSPDEGADVLARSNPEAAKKYPNTFGLFLPGGDFNYEEYRRQLNAGTREQVTPEDALKMANQRIATAIYSRAREQVGSAPGPEQREWLRTVKDLLADKYPGYTGVPSNLAKTPEMVKELERAAQDPDLSGTDAGKGLTVYLQAREQAMQAARAAGLSTYATADKALPLRQWLRQVGDQLTRQHPGFGEMYDRVLSREMAADEETP